MKQLLRSLRMPILVIMGFLSFFSANSQTSYYINDNSTVGDVFTSAVGNDANTGISSAPLLTLEAAYAKAQNGDTIYVDAGTYFFNRDYFIQKEITFIGANNNITPNDTEDKEKLNGTRNKETEVIALSLTIKVSNVSFQGFTFDPGNRTPFTVNEALTSNFKLLKNRFKINSSLNQIHLIGSGTTDFTPAQILNTNVIISDNRFEKYTVNTGTTIVAQLFKNITISNNSFVTNGAATSFEHTAMALGFDNRPVDEVYVTSNLFDSLGLVLSGGRLGRVVLSNNRMHNTRHLYNFSNSYPHNSEFEFSDNQFESSLGIPTMGYNRQGGHLGTTSVYKVENNIIDIVSPGTSPVLGNTPLNITVAGSVINPTVTVRGNKLSFAGNFGLVAQDLLRPIVLRWNLRNVLIENNEITYSGTQLGATSSNNLPVLPAISIYTDNGVGQTIPSGSLINILNNKIHGFRESVIIYDLNGGAGSSSNPFVGYGNLGAGVTVNINNNSFTGDVASINSGTSSQLIQASCNWYGSTAGQDVLSKISTATVQHIPWLSNGTDNDIATGFQPLANVCNGYPSSLYVNDNSQTGDRFTTAVGNNSNPGTVAAPFGSVSYAISKAKNGDTIYVDAGTYIENIIINKSITLRGAYYGENPLHSLNRGNESIIIPAVQTLGLPGTIIQPAANNITIDGLLLDGDNPALTEGSLINGVDVNIGCGIYNNDIVAANLTVKNTIVKNVQSYGIGLFRTLGNTNGPAVSGNLFTQNRVDNIGTRGIVFGYNAFGDITNNYISRCGLSGTWFSQQRVQNVNNVPSFISGNIVENSNVGMQSSSVQTPASQIIYLNNELSNNTASNFAGFSFIGVGNASGIVAANNKISGFARGVTINASNATIPISINNNSITNFTNFAIEVFSSNPVNATCNWYGSAAAQNFINKISLAADIDIIPWLTNGTDNDAATGFQPVTGACDGYPPVITLNSFTNVTCNGAANGSINITASYGKAPFTFTWTKDGDAAFISNVEDPTDFGPGTYRLTVTDANGTNLYVTSTEAEEPETIVVTIAEPTVLTTSISNTSTACSNIATVTANGGTTGYTYLWSNGSTAATISGVPAGIYTVTVTDANGCTTIATVNLTVSEAFNPSASVTNVTCFGANNGVINVTKANGTAPFMFSKDGGVTFEPGTLPYNFTNLAPGTYTIAVKDANGCVGFIDRTVTQPTQLVATINTVQSACFGQNNGAASITVAGGIPAYTYSWTREGGGFSSTQLNISAVSAGNYTLTVTDKNGCTVVLPVTIPSNNEIVVNAAITNVLCRNTATGAINLTVTGGTGAGFTYSWSGAANSSGEDLNNIGAANNYNVRITDIGSGCFVDRSYQVTQPAALTLSLSGINATDCNLGTITASAGGGTGNYQFNLNGGTYQSSNIFNGLEAGTYTVGVRDANGCVTSVQRTITDNGGDEYESNNSRNQAKTIVVGNTINARLAIANDAADWFTFTAPVSTSGLYSITILHPTASYTINIYPSGKSSAAITPTSIIDDSERHYQLTAGATYFVSITTSTLSYKCYSLTVRALEPIEGSNRTQNNIAAAPTVDILKAFTYPNPHNGNFTLNIESPEDGVATIEMYTVNGQKLSERKANIVKGKGNAVKYSNMNYAILFYKVSIGKQVVTGKIISPN